MKQSLHLSKVNSKIQLNIKIANKNILVLKNRLLNSVNAKYSGFDMFEITLRR